MDKKYQYILMQAPKKGEDDYAPEIRIIDNSRAIGKKKVERLCMDGWNSVGVIDTYLLPSVLRSGICRNESDKIAKYEEMFRAISDVADSYLLM